MEKEFSRMQVIDLIAEAIITKMDANIKAYDMISNTSAKVSILGENKALRGILESINDYIKEEI